jgi:hypothetical protein
MFKSAEDREAERREREAQRAREDATRAERERQAQEARERAAFLATPVGAATAAKEEGQTFFEVQLEVGGHVAGETSTARVFMSGEATAVSGVTVGVYLFRSTSAAPAPAV